MKKKEQTVGMESKREKVGLVTLALSFVKGSQIPRFYLMLLVFKYRQL